MTNSKQDMLDFSDARLPNLFLSPTASPAPCRYGITGVASALCSHDCQSFTQESLRAMYDCKGQVHTDVF